MICLDHDFEGDGGRCTTCERLLRFHPHPFEQSSLLSGAPGRCICGALRNVRAHE